MSRRPAAWLAAAFFAATLGQPLHADFAAVDPVPAATLLLPYFEVDLDDVNGESTSFRVANSSPLPVIAHVVLWTDWAIPTFGFEIYLDGNGAVDVDLREVFAGRLPAPVPFVLAARTSGGGIPFDPCSPPFLDIDEMQHLATSHSGLASPGFGNRCAGAAFGDGHARGFATVDVLEGCTNLLPTSASYFEDEAIVDDVLWGTFAQIDRSQGTSAGELLVPLEAVGFDPGFSFYTNIAASGGSDGREPLPPQWSAPFFDDPTRSTEVVVWRDPGESTVPQPCGTEPTWFPLTSGQVRLYDDGGSPVDVTAFEPFPLATNRVTVGASELPTPPGFTLGMIRLNLAALILEAAQTSGIFIPPAPQAYMWVLHHHGAGEAAAQAASTLVPPP